MFFLVLSKLICLFRGEIFILETIRGCHMNTETGGFWYSMYTKLSGTRQNQSNSMCITFKISNVLRFVYFQIMFRIDHSQMFLQNWFNLLHYVPTTLIIINYVDVRNTKMVWNGWTQPGWRLTALWRNTLSLSTCNLL